MPPCSAVVRPALHILTVAYAFALRSTTWSILHQFHVVRQVSAWNDAREEGNWFGKY